MSILGYFVFLVSLIVVLPIVGLLVGFLLLPFGIAASSTVPRDDVIKTGKNPVAGIFGGIVGGISLGAVTYVIQMWFGSNEYVMFAVTALLLITAGPKIHNAAYAIPTTLVVYLAMILWLL